MSVMRTTSQPFRSNFCDHLKVKQCVTVMLSGLGIFRLVHGLLLVDLTSRSQQRKTGLTLTPSCIFQQVTSHLITLQN